MSSSSMLELRLAQPTVLKNLRNILEALSDLFSEASFDFSRTAGLELQAMDTTTRVAVVQLLLRAEGFDHYRCDRDVISMSLDLADMATAFRCAKDDDILTINAEDQYFSDIATFKFDSPERGEILYFDLDYFAGPVNGVPLEILEISESEY